MPKGKKAANVLTLEELRALYTVVPRVVDTANGEVKFTDEEIIFSPNLEEEEDSEYGDRHGDNYDDVDSDEAYGFSEGDSSENSENVEMDNSGNLVYNLDDNANGETEEKPIKEEPLPPNAIIRNYTSVVVFDKGIISRKTPVDGPDADAERRAFFDAVEQMMNQDKAGHTTYWSVMKTDLENLRKLTDSLPKEKFIQELRLADERKLAEEANEAGADKTPEELEAKRRKREESYERKFIRHMRKVENATKMLSYSANNYVEHKLKQGTFVRDTADKNRLELAYGLNNYLRRELHQLTPYVEKTSFRAKEEMLNGQEKELSGILDLMNDAKKKSIIDSGEFKEMRRELKQFIDKKNIENLKSINEFAKSEKFNEEVDEYRRGLQALRAKAEKYLNYKKGHSKNDEASRLKVEAALRLSSLIDSFDKEFDVYFKGAEEKRAARFAAPDNGPAIAEAEDYEGKEYAAAYFLYRRNSIEEKTDENRSALEKRDYADTFDSRYLLGVAKKHMGNEELLRLVFSNPYAIDIIEKEKETENLFKAIDNARESIESGKKSLEQAISDNFDGELKKSMLNYLGEIKADNKNREEDEIDEPQQAKAEVKVEKSEAETSRELCQRYCINRSSDLYRNSQVRDEFDESEARRFGVVDKENGQDVPLESQAKRYSDILVNNDPLLKLIFPKKDILSAVLDIANNQAEFLDFSNHISSARKDLHDNDDGLYEAVRHNFTGEVQKQLLGRILQNEEAKVPKVIQETIQEAKEIPAENKELLEQKAFKIYAAVNYGKVIIDVKKDPTGKSGRVLGAFSKNIDENKGLESYERALHNVESEISDYIHNMTGEQLKDALKDSESVRNGLVDMIDKDRDARKAKRDADRLKKLKDKNAKKQAEEQKENVYSNSKI